MKRHLLLSLLVVMMPSAYAELLADSAAGKRLHDANCMGCHDTAVYTRKDHAVRSLDALKQQLDSCGHAAGKEFSALDKENILKYLNDQFYHFR